MSMALSAQEPAADTEWSVENLGPSINSAYSERDSVVSNDGLSLYFSSDRPTNDSGELQSWNIFVASREAIAEPFGKAINIGPGVNSAYNDHSASLSPDGLTMYFSSDRPGGCGGQDLYFSRRTDSGDPASWSEPVHLGCKINSELDEICPIFSGDPATNLGLLYFSRDVGPDEIDFDLYVTQFVMDALEFEEPLPLNELNTPTNDWHFDPNYGLLWSEREGGSGASDIWQTSWIEEFFGWKQPVNLGSSINSGHNEGRPSVSVDGALYFPSNRPGGHGAEDIYVAVRSDQ